MRYDPGLPMWEGSPLSARGFSNMTTASSNHLPLRPTLRYRPASFLPRQAAEKNTPVLASQILKIVGHVSSSIEKRFTALSCVLHLELDASAEDPDFWHKVDEAGDNVNVAMAHIMILRRTTLGLSLKPSILREREVG